MFRDFDAERAERARTAGLTPTTARLGGQDLTIAPTVPFGAMLDLADAPEFAQDRPAAYRAAVAFIDAAVIEGDGAAAANAVDEETLVSFLDWLVEQFTGRPSEPSAGSAPPSQPDGRATSTPGPEQGTEAA